MSDLVPQITGTCLMVAFACVVSGASFPPSNVPLQLFIAGLWFVTGFLVCKLWH